MPSAGSALRTLLRNLDLAGTLSVENPAVTPFSLSGQRSNPVPADWRVRFGDAYRTELQEWITSLGQGQPQGPNAWDGYAAISVAESVVQLPSNYLRGLGGRSRLGGGQRPSAGSRRRPG